MFLGIDFNIMVVHPAYVFTKLAMYTVFTPRITSVSLLLGHHHVTKTYNYDIKVIPIQRIRWIGITVTCFGPLGPSSGD
jgi:hypothetical protein